MAVLKIIPLGGLNEIGKNLTVFEFKEDMFVLDCGISFPQDDMPGVDIVIPDMSYLIANKHKLKGVVITHGHEDHIGAVGHLLRDINVPVYGARLTIGLLESKLNEMGLLSTSELKVIDGDTVLSIGAFKLEFIQVNHSIPDTYAVAIHSPVGTVVHSADFKMDLNPVNEQPIDLEKFSRLGKQGVLLLMADSTNANKEGYSLSEQAVAESLDSLFRKTNSRIIVASFASNIHRIQQILKTAEKYNRKVCVFGYSMRNNIKKSIELGYIQVKQGVLIEEFELKNYKSKNLVLLVAGSQGESNSALSRMAFGRHPKVSIEKKDLVVISASVIPGNEKYLYKVINELFKNGAEVVYQSLSEVHASGHAYAQELKLLLSVVKPKFYMPVHGEYMHLLSNAKLANEMGIAEKNVFILENGDVLQLSSNSCSLGTRIKVGSHFVDGYGVGDLGEDVLKDRITLSQEGLISILAVIDKDTNTLKSQPVIVTKGFMYESESAEIIRAIKVILNGEFTAYSRKKTNINELQNAIGKKLKTYLYSETKRNPVIMPVVIEV